MVLKGDNLRFYKDQKSYRTTPDTLYRGEPAMELVGGKAEIVVTGLCLQLQTEGLCYLQATLHQFTEDQDTWSSLFSPGSNFSCTYGHCRDTGL